VNRLLIFVIVSGLAIGSAGVLTHNTPALAVGVVMSLGGLLLAAQAL